MSSTQVAILIVNGGEEPKYGRWLELALNKLQCHTDGPDYHLYIWNNNVKDSWVEQFAGRFPNLTLTVADPTEKLRHSHAVPLQRLYEQARKDGMEYIVALDSDAHPIRLGWLEALVSSLREGAALSGVWRDEEQAGIRPYIHASCLATTTKFIEENQLRWDFIAPRLDAKHDTLSSFTDKALELGMPLYKLHRSNRNQLHRVIGGIYGGVIYHHGGGSRLGVQFWDEPRTRKNNRDNTRIRDIAAGLLFKHYDLYMAWLLGDSAVEEELGRLLVGLKEEYRWRHREIVLEAFYFLSRFTPSSFNDKIGQSFRSMKKRLRQT
ncbi:MAG: hypothetical protein L0332_13295 [Chloroflexi bacterium]|nr:hypothetical protein [Chloroflexota bacterium]MCI0645751.1 hypothetical protein [Chloroflexota bacterium]MCI0727678.1 hypothetical protein [Chloroflexota bacterium]